MPPPYGAHGAVFRLESGLVPHPTTPLPHVSLITRAFRIARLVLHVVYGMLIASMLLPCINATRRERVISRWATSLLQLMHVRITITGQPPPADLRGTMFVANHVSWVDIHALNTVRTVRFISKAEVRHWPVFGWFAHKANTLFIDRSRKQDAARIVNEVTASLRHGDCLCYFPEGTTTDGTELRPFKGSLMQAAINAGSPVWPFTVRYPGPQGQPNTEMAYYGDISLLQSMWHILSQRHAEVHLHFLPPIASTGQDRRELTRLVQQRIAAELALPAKPIAPTSPGPETAE